MSKIVVNPPAHLVSRDRDVDLTPEQLTLLGVFASLKKAPTFAKFPGSCVLRQYRAGEIVCRQADPGGTAFYVLTCGDIDALLRQLASPPAQNDNTAAGGSVSAITAALRRVKEHIEELLIPPGGDLRRVATARLSVGAAPSKRRQSWKWPIRNQEQVDIGEPDPPSFIANDGPSEIDYQTRQAPIYEGDVFGEMSCLTLQPRSASIVAEVDCFVLEFLRSILDQMRRDPQYKERSEKKYRDRVLENHLRKLSVFQWLTDEQFRDVQDDVELIELDPGTVLWDEGDPPDAMYVVRSGIIQVVQSFPWKIREEDIRDWKKIIHLLSAKETASGAAAVLKSVLPQISSDETSADQLLNSDSLKREVLVAFNEAAKSGSLIAAKEMKQFFSDPVFHRETAGYPPKTTSWTGLQVRRATRVLYSILFPDALAPPAPIGLVRVLQYLGQGSALGEIGLVLGQPRSATCLAYAHPDPNREATAVELIRIPAQVLRDMTARSTQVRDAVAELISTRQERDVAVTRMSLHSLTRSQRAQELGLLQGQKLMLIDLDRCTRCGDCVQACIDTHQDGYSRLFLDGPRYSKYLVPSSCRQCRDPVCMIGCPVGSIQQGDNGEIRIRDWCIGCGVCARQCPYDSIQMQEAAIIWSGSANWLWQQGLPPSDFKRWTRHSFRPKDWSVGITPFRWGIAMQQLAWKSSRNSKPSAKPEVAYFRCGFRIETTKQTTPAGYHLIVKSQGSALEVYLNEARKDLSQDAAQAKRNEYSTHVPPAALRKGENLLAISVAPAEEFDSLVLDVRLEALARESEQLEIKLADERAVVCDQCSGLAGNRHACVYACPHEAAMRIDAWTELPQG